MLRKENGIASKTIPAHTSHRTQPLHVSVFSTFKTHIRNYINNLRLTLSDEQRKDVFNACEILHEL